MEKFVRADKPCLRVKFEDGLSEFYLDDHPKFTEEEKGIYLNAEDVKVLSLASKP